MTILINCTAKFCYRHRNFQNTEAATGGVFKSFIKFIRKHLCQSLSGFDNYHKITVCSHVHLPKFWHT